MRGTQFLANLAANQAANNFLNLSGHPNDAQVQTAAQLVGQTIGSQALQFAQQMEQADDERRRILELFRQVCAGELDPKKVKVSQDGVEVVKGRPSAAEPVEEVVS